MPTSRSDWPEHVKPGARKAFHNEYPQLPAEYPRYFNIETSSRATEFDLVSAGLGTAATVSEGQEIPLDQPIYRGKVTYTHLKYGLGYEATEELKEDDLYKKIVPAASRDLARSMRDTEETQAATVYNLAFTTQQAYDGVSLIDVAHPGAGGGADQANQPATDIDISVPALQAALERAMLMQDDRGLRIKIQYSQLVHHPNNFWLVREILQSDKKPFTSNNEPNIVGQQGIEPSTWRYLTDTDAWFLLASKGQHMINFFWRRQPRFRDVFDERAEVLQFLTSMRFSFGATDWRGIDGSTGA